MAHSHNDHQTFERNCLSVRELPPGLPRRTRRGPMCSRCFAERNRIPLSIGQRSRRGFRAISCRVPKGQPVRVVWATPRHRREPLPTEFQTIVAPALTDGIRSMIPSPNKTDDYPASKPSEIDSWKQTRSPAGKRPFGKVRSLGSRWDSAAGQSDRLKSNQDSDPAGTGKTR